MRPLPRAALIAGLHLLIQAVVFFLSKPLRQDAPAVITPVLVPLTVLLAECIVHFIKSRKEPPIIGAEFVEHVAGTLWSVLVLAATSLCFLRLTSRGAYDYILLVLFPSSSSPDRSKMAAVIGLIVLLLTLCYVLLINLKRLRYLAFFERVSETLNHVASCRLLSPQSQLPAPNENDRREQLLDLIRSILRSVTEMTAQPSFTAIIRRVTLRRDIKSAWLIAPVPGLLQAPASAPMKKCKYSTSPLPKLFPPGFQVLQFYADREADIYQRLQHTHRPRGFDCEDVIASLCSMARSADRKEYGRLVALCKGAGDSPNRQRNVHALAGQHVLRLLGKVHGKIPRCSLAGWVFSTEHPVVVGSLSKCVVLDDTYREILVSRAANDYQ